MVNTCIKKIIVYFYFMSHSVSLLNHAQPAILPSLYTSVRTRRASSQNHFCRRWKYSLLLLRLMRLNDGWCCHTVGKEEEWGGGGGEGEEEGRNTLSQVSTITQKCSYLKCTLLPPHLHTSTFNLVSRVLFKSLRQGENPGNNAQPFLLGLLNSYFTNLDCQLFTTLIRPS